MAFLLYYDRFAMFLNYKISRDFHMISPHATEMNYSFLVLNDASFTQIDQSLSIFHPISIEFSHNLIDYLLIIMY